MAGNRPRAIRQMPYGRGVIILSLLAVALAITPALAQGKTLHAEQYDVTIQVMPNGDMQIVERQEIAFTRGIFSQGFAVIPTERTEGITNVQFVGDGAPFVRGDGEKPGTYDVQDEGTQIAVVWGFKPTSGSTHVYELRYTVRGGLRYYPEYGEVWWKAIPPEHAYEIRNASIEIRLPPGAVILSDPETGFDYAGTEPAITQVELAPDRLSAVFTAERTIQADEEVEVRVRFRPGVVGGQAPAWQAEFDEREVWDEMYRPTINLALLLLGAATVLGGPLLVLAVWYVFGRDPAVGLVAEQFSRLPSDTPPGVVGALIDEEANLQDIVATLVDLARRGYLIISESALDSDYVFARTEKPADDVRPHERLLLDEFFTQTLARPLSNLRHKFDAALPKLQAALYDELIRAKFFQDNPESMRQRYANAAWTLIILALAGSIVAMLAVPALYADKQYLALPFVGVGVTGLALLVAAPHMPHKTRKGAHEAAVWRAFKNYLAQLEKYNLPEASARFDEYLPYAVAFGLEKTLIQKFAAAQAPLPEWYVPLHVDPLRRRQRLEAARTPGQALLSPQLGAARPPSVQGMSDGLSGSLQGASNGLMSMFNSASQTVASRSRSSSSRGWSGSSSGRAGRSSFGGSFGSSRRSSGGGGGFRRGGGGGGGRRGFR